MTCFSDKYTEIAETTMPVARISNEKLSNSDAQ